MRIFALLFFVSSLSFAQEDLLVDSMCEVIGDDFYELTLDRQNGKSLASSTRKARAMVKTFWAESMAIYDQDAVMPLNALNDGWFVSDEFVEDQPEMFVELYVGFLPFVYERSEKPDLYDYRKEEARFVRDYIFASCKKGLTRAVERREE